MNDTEEKRVKDPEKLARVKEAWQKELEYYRNLHPKQRAQNQLDCMKFCLRKVLFSKEENARLSTDKEYQKEMALTAMKRKVTYLDHHPEEA